MSIGARVDRRFDVIRMCGVRSARSPCDEDRTDNREYAMSWLASAQCPTSIARLAGRNEKGHREALEDRAAGSTGRSGRRRHQLGTGEHVARLTVGQFDDVSSPRTVPGRGPSGDALDQPRTQVTAAPGEGEQASLRSR
jgi:hypothetical protein